MNLEHIGFNVSDPVAVAQWYVRHLGMKVARQFGAPGHGHFLTDALGKMMLEFYFNSKASVPDYAALAPMSFHVAFQVDDVAVVRERLLQAGAKSESEVLTNDEGDNIALLRDPWGLTVQLIKRAKTMV